MSKDSHITAEHIQSRLIDAANAIEHEDYRTALNKFEAARALMAGVPRFVLAKSEVQYTPEQLDAQIERMRRLARIQNGGGHIVSQPTEFYRRTRGSE